MGFLEIVSVLRYDGDTELNHRHGLYPQGAGNSLSANEVVLLFLFARNHADNRNILV